MKHVLYISGSVGLGHVVRDAAIAGALRRGHSGIRISWLAGSPAREYLAEAGEPLLRETSGFADSSSAAEQVAGKGAMNLFSYVLHARPGWRRNVELFRRIMETYRFNLVVSDEAYEIDAAVSEEPDLLHGLPYVMIHDFIGLEPVSANPLEWLGVRVINRNWIKTYGAVRENMRLLFAGEPEDVPEARFGFGLPRRREFAENRYDFTGYVLPFDPERIMQDAGLRKRLGYGEYPLIVCSFGGTSIGESLVKLCIDAFSSLRAEIPRCRMVIVLGPRMNPDHFTAPEGVILHGFVPRLYEHCAAADLCICQAGGTTTLECTALQVPFIYFPITGHSEQINHVRSRLKRHRAGTEMDIERTGPSELAEKITSLLGKDVVYENVHSGGAARAAGIMHEML